MRPSAFLPHAVLATLVLVTLGVSACVARLAPLPDGEDEYNAPGFVVRHAWTRFAMLGARPFRDDPSAAEEDAVVARFFELNALIGERDRTAGDPASDTNVARVAAADARRYRDERARIENRVERIIEGRVTDVLRDAGLTRQVGRYAIVWPPVSIEFEEPPAVLVKSPRAEIRKESESLLDGDLPADRVARIESDAERDGATSALVVNIGAIATYPAIVPPSPDYGFVLEEAAHEWMHHYLYFAPLGRRYYDSGELRTLNETVANMAGRALGSLLEERDPLSDVIRDAPAARATATEVDFVAEMRALRREVEALLARGEVARAEQLMEEKRRFLTENGYYIRRLNQAYFAFHGSYADTAGSIDPIGPKLEALLQASGTIEAFVETAREFRSASDLDAALAD